MNAKETRFDEVFASEQLSEDLKCFPPISKEQFDDIHRFCGPVLEENIFRSVSKKDLFLFLSKMRQGLSDEFLKVIFDYRSRERVSLAISTVLRSLVQRFVPENIGLASITK